jgi:hypothetical protein
MDTGRAFRYHSSFFKLAWMWMWMWISGLYFGQPEARRYICLGGGGGGYAIGCRLGTGTAIWIADCGLRIAQLALARVLRFYKLLRQSSTRFRGKDGGNQTCVVVSRFPSSRRVADHGYVESCRTQDPSVQTRRRSPNRSSTADCSDVPQPKKRRTRLLCDIQR